MRAHIRNCLLCNEPMETSPFRLCSDCLQDTARVYSYIRKHARGSSLEEISRVTCVPLPKVKKMVAKGIHKHHEKLS